MEGRQYRYPSVYVSDPNDFPIGATETTINPWYPKLRDLIECVPHVIALVSPTLNSIRDGAPGGLGLLSEILYFWHRDQTEPGFASKLIPICVGCGLENLKSEQGHYEQLQDIAVPLMAGLRPMSISAAAIANDKDVRALAEALAKRIGPAPKSGTA